MTEGLVFQTKIHFRAGRSGRKQLVRGEKPAEFAKPGRMPWVSKLMALAIRFDGLVRDGAVVDQAELARLGHEDLGSRGAGRDTLRMFDFFTGPSPEPRYGYSVFYRFGHALRVL